MLSTPPAIGNARPLLSQPPGSAVSRERGDRAMRPPEYCHRSTGRLRFDPGQGMPWFDPWYALVECDEGIIDYLSWLLLRHGIDLLKGSRWGAHVTSARGEPPPLADHWAWCDGLQVELFYTHAIHWTNGYHAWVN